MWTEDEMEIIKNEYGKNGLNCVMNLLPNKKINVIKNKIYELGLKLNSKVDSEQFLNITTKEISYILGFLWADGYIRKGGIYMWILEEDARSIKPTFLKTGNWNIYYRKLKNRKEQMCFHTSNKMIYDFLLKNDYENKSKSNQEKILSLIPDNLKHYFFRGYFDGDGSIWKTFNQSILNITSTYEQDWSTMEELMKNLNIKYSISRIKSLNKENRINRCSRVVTQNMDGIIKFCNYIYKNFEIDNIGLKRKYNIFLDIKNKYNSKINKKMNIFCTNCGSSEIISRGKYKIDENKKRFTCKDCNKNFIN